VLTHIVPESLRVYVYRWLKLSILVSHDWGVPSLPRSTIPTHRNGLGPKRLALNDSKSKPPRIPNRRDATDYSAIGSKGKSVDRISETLGRARALVSVRDGPGGPSNPPTHRLQTPTLHPAKCLLGPSPGSSLLSSSVDAQRQ
jgi:hypothetical protein